MITVRAGPRMSVIAGPICQTQYMFNAMCSSPAWSHPALKTVHQRPSPKTGYAPLAPNRIRIVLLGERADRMPPPPMAPPDINSVTTHNVTHVPTTSGAKLKVAPRLRTIGPNPHKPGFE